VERLGVLCRSSEVRADDLFFAGVVSGQEDAPETLSLADAECRHILKVLNLFSGHRSKTAEALGIDRKTLREKIRRCGLE